MALLRQNLFGRTVIYTNHSEITRENVLDVLQKAVAIHTTNASDIEYLYNYYKGDQPILEREKEIRPEINNQIVENRANEIVSFKVGYLMGEPIQYVNRGGDEDTEDLKTLNDYMFAEDKAAKDKALADWFHICGTSYRMVLPDPNNEEDDSPFEIYTLDPRLNFIVYHSGLGHKKMMAVSIITLEDNTTMYSGYTKDTYFEIANDEILTWRPNNLGEIPMIEYPANEARLGAFEIVLPILDAINTAESNRLDGVEQFIQALLVLKGVDITDKDFGELREKGGLKLPIDGDAYYLTQELNQTQTQTLVDHMYETVLTICGMPNRNGGTSTSDTGTAVIYRDGWGSAEARAKDSELMFKMSEKEFLRVALKIMNNKRRMDLKLTSVEIRFTRRNYENIVEKTNVLTSMLNNDKIHPRLAFEHSGMFVDPEIAYQMSQAYEEEQTAKGMAELEAFNRSADNVEKEEIVEADV